MRSAALSFVDAIVTDDEDDDDSMFHLRAEEAERSEAQPVESVESSAQQEQEETKMELARLLAEQAKWTKARTHSENRLKETKKKLARLRAEQAKWTTARTKLEKERDELTKERDDLTKERDDLTKERDDLTEERDGLTGERDGLKETNNRLFWSYVVHRLQSEQLATQRNSDLARFRAEEAKWTEERTELEKERDELKEAAHVFSVGDRAVITNKHKGKQGTTGTVKRVTTCQVTIEDDRGNLYTRSRFNMRKI